MQEAEDYRDRIGLGRAFETWQAHFGLPRAAADIAYAITSYWYRHPEAIPKLEVPAEMQEFVA
jgi:hypothetical protein